MLSIIFALILLLPGMASATTYYASASGSGSACTIGTPCLIASAWGLLNPGDTLIVNDGTYTGSSSMLSPPSGFNVVTNVCNSIYGGSSGNLITVKAANDGLAIIDGQYARLPAVINCVEYVQFEGLRIQNSSGSVLTTRKANRNVFLRLSLYNGNYRLNPNLTVCPTSSYQNFHVMELTRQSSYNVIEDVIFSGSGRDLFNFFGNSNFNILKRALLIGGGYTRDLTMPNGCTTASSSNHGEAMQIYGSSDNVVENTVAIGIGNWAGHTTREQAGVNIWANTGENAHRNSYFNTVVMGYPYIGLYISSVCNGGASSDSDICIIGATVENVVVYQTGLNIYARNGRNISFNKVTTLSAGQGLGVLFPTLHAGIYVPEGYDTDKSSSWTFDDMIVANNVFGCHGTTTLQAEDAPFSNSVFYNNSTANFYQNCSAVPKTNVTQGVNPTLTSLVYVAPTSPVVALGQGGAAPGADLRCKYNSTISGSVINTVVTTDDMWPLPALLNNRAKVETLEILGAEWDINAAVLDALGPRNTSELPCPTGSPSLPPDDTANYITSQGATSTTHNHVIPVGTDFLGVCVGAWDTEGAVGNITGVTSGGEALTLIAEIASPSPFRKASLWGKLAPTSGTRSIGVSTSGAVDGLITTSFIKEGVLSIRGGTTSSGLGQTPAVTVITANDELLVDCMATTKSSTATHGPDQTQQEQTDHASLSLRLSLSEQYGSAGGVMSWALGSNAYWAHAVASLSPQTPNPPPSSYTRTVTEYRLEPFGEMNASTASLGGGQVRNTGSVRLRFQITGGVAGVPQTTYHLYCKLNAGAYVRVMDEYGSNVFRLTGNRYGSFNPAPLSVTFDHITGGNFVSGALVLNEADAYTVAPMPVGYSTEMIWMIDLNATAGDVIRCRPHLDTGVALDTPDGVVAAITAVSVAAGAP